MKKDLRQGYAALIIVSFFWGTTYVASKIGTAYMPGIFVSGIRQLLSGLILTSFFLAKGYKIPPWKILKKIFIQGLFLLLLANGLVTWSLEFINSGMAAIIAALVPLFIALFTISLTKSAVISGLMFLGLLLGLAGVIIIFYDAPVEMRNKSFISGILMALVAALCWSFGSVYTSRQNFKVNYLFSAGLQMLIAGIILVPICFASGKYVHPLDIPLPGWEAISYLVVVGSIITYSAYILAIAKLPPMLVSVYAYINPIVAVILGWLLLNEKLNFSMTFGTALILYSVYLVNKEFRKQKITK